MPVQTLCDHCGTEMKQSDRRSARIRLSETMMVMVSFLPPSEENPGKRLYVCQRCTVGLVADALVLLVRQLPR